VYAKKSAFLPGTQHIEGV